MRKLSFRERYLNMLKEIEASPYTHIISIEKEFRQLTVPEINRSMKRIEGGLGYKLPDNFKQYIFPSSRLSVCWHYEIDGKYEVGGEFSLRNLYAVLCVEQDQLWTEHSSEPEKKFLKTLRVFDRYPNVGADKYTAFKVEDKVASPEIWYCDEDDDRYYKLDLEYNDYLECLLETRGFYGWQILFSSKIESFVYKHRDLASNTTIKWIQKRLEDMPKLFPNTDFSKYQQRFDNIFKRKHSK